MNKFMTPQEVASFLQSFNLWRRGEDIPMPDPKDIGEAIDAAIAFLRGQQ